LGLLQDGPTGNILKDPIEERFGGLRFGSPFLKSSEDKEEMLLPPSENSRSSLPSLLNLLKHLNLVLAAPNAWFTRVIYLTLMKMMGFHVWVVILMMRLM
jgi:hypothetical protein